MNFFLRLLFPDLVTALRDLRKVVGQPKTNTHCKLMSLDTAQEIAVIESAITVITDLKAANAEAVAALEPLTAANAELQTVIDGLNQGDADSDAALERLAALINPPAPDPDPTPDPEPLP